MQPSGEANPAKAPVEKEWPVGVSSIFCVGISLTLWGAIIIGVKAALWAITISTAVSGEASNSTTPAVQMSKSQIEHAVWQNGGAPSDEWPG